MANAFMYTALSVTFKSVARFFLLVQDSGVWLHVLEEGYMFWLHVLEEGSGQDSRALIIDEHA